MKKEKKSSAWKNELLNGLGELIFLFSCMAIGLGIFALFPHEVRKDIPFEIVIILGILAFLPLIGIVALVVYLVKKKKKAKDLRVIYNRLKSNYKLTLMTITRKVDEEYRDIPIIRGKTSTGKFDLSQGEQAFDFSVEYFTKSGAEKFSHTYPQDVNAAISCIKEFMSGETALNEK